MTQTWQGFVFRFQSYGYDTDDIFLFSAYDKVVVDKAAYTDNGEWEIIHCPVTQNTKRSMYESQGITMYLIIRRKPIFYIVHILVPCMIISCLSVGAFSLPNESCEKTNMSISLLLGLPVYLLLLAKRVPETSLAIPVIGAYLLFTMGMVTASVIFSVLLSNVYHSSKLTREMGPRFRYIFLTVIPPLIGMSHRIQSLRRSLRDLNQSTLAGNATLTQVYSRNNREDVGADLSQIEQHPKNRRGSLFPGQHPVSLQMRYAGVVKQGNIFQQIQEEEWKGFVKSGILNEEETKNEKKSETPHAIKMTPRPNPHCVSIRREGNSLIPFDDGTSSGSGQMEYTRLTCNNNAVSRNETSVQARRIADTTCYFNIGHEVSDPALDQSVNLAYHISAGADDANLNTAKSAEECNGTDTVRLANFHPPIGDSIISSRGVKSSTKEADVTPASSNLCGSPDWDHGFAAVDQISEHFKFKNEYDGKAMEWRTVSAVLDCLMSRTFVLLNVIGTLYLGIEAFTNFPPDHPFVAGDPKYASCWEDHSH